MSLRIEILISTMFKQDLAFLEPMFIHNNIDDFDLIIVNQTVKDKLLVSDKKNIKVINSFERGSPASRNLAIKNATKDICLMADDDIVYNDNLKNNILEAYKEHPNAAMISFEAVDESGKLYTNYHPQGKHNNKSLKKIYTWVITFNRKMF
ncbi:glycosyltransferase family A protein, partial [Psychroserpens sp.]|uniref:glycosyltransferase family A protein n=1 Tax=Psychroserpens sp. TaxID=2020870 RepID=UPI00385C936E